MSLARETNIVADLARSNSPGKLAVPISLNVLSPLVAIFDLGWIVVLGVFAGLLYDSVALGVMARHKTISVQGSLWRRSIRRLVMRPNSIVGRISFGANGR